MILLKASEVTRTHSIVCRDNCCWQNANLEFNHAANWSWHSVKTATKIKSKGEKEKMNGWDVIKKQEGSLLTSFLHLFHKINHRQNNKLACVWESLFFKTLIRLLTWAVLSVLNWVAFESKLDQMLKIIIDKIEAIFDKLLQKSKNSILSERQQIQFFCSYLSSIFLFSEMQSEMKTFE